MKCPAENICSDFVHAQRWLGGCESYWLLTRSCLPHVYNLFVVPLLCSVICRTERKKYHSHRGKSRANPEKFMTIIIDGMDQARTNLPNTKLIAKSTSALWQLRTHVTGILIHTKAPYGKLAFAFVDLLQWPHDSNLTITLLLNAIVNYKEHHPLPKTLYIQMDNTSREDMSLDSVQSLWN